MESSETIVFLKTQAFYLDSIWKIDYFMLALFDLTFLGQK